ncbi:MAG TPA: DNA polymerase I, partial [Actinomycetota bacterium]|nr:DNA polymerase I [Actinomycetota bacterium]
MATGARPPDQDAPRRLFLLDGHSLSYRAFFALPPSLATTSGQVTNAVYGFTSMLIKLLAEERPDLIAVAFDKGPPTVRLEQYAEYKAGRRETPDEFRQQLPLIHEVVETLRIPIVEVEGYEADDAIATLATQAQDHGVEAVIVTADRDFFQLVRPGITVLFNRKGISDIVRYDEAAITERFGLPPSKYLEYVALKGDASDNIPGVPGVGEKTASKLVQDYGTAENLLENTAELKGRIREGIEAAGDDLVRNRELARLHVDLDLPIGPEDCAMGEWDPEAVRRLFNSLEFRTLFERLEDVGRSTKPAVEAASVDVGTGTVADVERLLGLTGPKALVVAAADGLQGVAVSPGGGAATFAAAATLSKKVAAWLADAAAPKWVHDDKQTRTAFLDAGADLRGVEFDTLLAGYLLDPAEAAYPLDALCRTYLGLDVLEAAEAVGEDGGAAPAPAQKSEGQLFSSGNDGTETAAAAADSAAALARRTGASAAAVGLLAPVMREKVERAGLDGLLRDVELPLSAVLAGMQAFGIALDVEYLREMSENVGDRMATLEADIYRYAGEEFNLNSPPQLRVILYEKLGLSPGKRTSKGALSTDADVLEKLRDRHPIVEAILGYRELSKLKSTYLDALPPLVSPRDGHIHTTFSQVGAATGRLSSRDPNLQNIPVRGDLGREIRRAFVPSGPKRELLVADYSQIELRVLAHLSGDEELAAAFAAGADIHAATAARVFDLPIDEVEPEMRRRAKVVNYGLAYGMNAYGLASRMGIAPDEAQEFIDSYFAGFPRIKDYLDQQVVRAAADGYTSTMLGRRRYLPELQSANPRIRDMGRRMALNAPIQGSAADVLKLAMIEVDSRLASSDLDCVMVLTVHDELVFDVAAGDREAAGALVKSSMEEAYPLSVPLRADLGWGRNWA